MTKPSEASLKRAREWIGRHYHYGMEATIEAESLAQLLNDVRDEALEEANAKCQGVWETYALMHQPTNGISACQQEIRALKSSAGGKP